MPFIGLNRVGQIKAILLSCLVFPAFIELASAAERKPLPTTALEEYEDPPMYIFRNGISPATISTFGAFTSYQVNVDTGSHNITGDAANEPSICVDPTNHN